MRGGSVPPEGDGGLAGVGDVQIVRDPLPLGLRVAEGDSLLAGHLVSRQIRTAEILAEAGCPAPGAAHRRFGATGIVTQSSPRRSQAYGDGIGGPLALQAIGVHSEGVWSCAGLGVQLR